MSTDVLNTARKALMDALGDKTKVYFDHMKLWFKMKITKEEFDTEARVLLNPEQVHLHNEFFLAILNKVDGLAEITSAQEKSSNMRTSSSHKRHKHSSKNSSDKSNFEVVDILDYVPPGSPPGTESDAAPRYASQEFFLPDHALVTGRFMLTAWEQGLEGTDDETVDLIVAAVQVIIFVYFKYIFRNIINSCLKFKVFLKNILTAVISKRKGYKIRDSSFIHDIGGDVPNMWLKNTDNLIGSNEDGLIELDDNGDLIPRCPLTIDEAEHRTAQNIACRYVFHFFYLILILIFLYLFIF